MLESTCRFERLSSAFLYPPRLLFDSKPAPLQEPKSIPTRTCTSPVQLHFIRNDDDAVFPEN